MNIHSTLIFLLKGVKIMINVAVFLLIVAVTTYVYGLITIFIPILISEKQKRKLIYKTAYGEGKKYKKHNIRPRYKK